MPPNGIEDPPDRRITISAAFTDPAGHSRDGSGATDAEVLVDSRTLQVSLALRQS